MGGLCVVPCGLGCPSYDTGMRRRWSHITLRLAAPRCAAPGRPAVQSTVERLEQLRQQREVVEVAECTFQPKIDRKSDAMMAERAETLKVCVGAGRAYVWCVLG